jgi:hypothetical protein
MEKVKRCSRLVNYQFSLVALVVRQPVVIRDAIRKQIASGKAHYQEEHLLEEMMLSGSYKSVGEKAGIQMPETEGMHVSDPTSIRKLVTPGICTSSIPSPLR